MSPESSLAALPSRRASSPTLGDTLCAISDRGIHGWKNHNDKRDYRARSLCLEIAIRINISVKYTVE
jgi:hypothetical protein